MRFFFDTILRVASNDANSDSVTKRMAMVLFLTYQVLSFKSKECTDNKVILLYNEQNFYLTKLLFNITFIFTSHNLQFFPVLFSS